MFNAGPSKSENFMVVVALPRAAWTELVKVSFT